MHSAPYKASIKNSISSPLKTEHYLIEQPQGALLVTDGLKRVIRSDFAAIFRIQTHYAYKKLNRQKETQTNKTIQERARLIGCFR